MPARKRSGKQKNILEDAAASASNEAGCWGII